MKKTWVKVTFIVIGVVLLAGFTRLGIFLYNVNRDLDYLEYQNYVLSQKVHSLELLESNRMSNEELQRIEQQQAALNNAYSEMNTIEQQNQQNQQDFQDYKNQQNLYQQEENLRREQRQEQGNR